MRRGQNGFTLTELMIVSVIVGILAAIAVPKFSDLIRKSREATAKAQLGTVRSALTIYYTDTEGLFPSGPTGNNRRRLMNVLTAGKKYMTSWPWLYVPVHHTPTQRIDNVDSDNFSVVHPNCVGGFIYVSDNTNTGWGKIGIECYHKDLNGIVWSRY